MKIMLKSHIYVLFILKIFFSVNSLDDIVQRLAFLWGVGEEEKEKNGNSHTR